MADYRVRIVLQKDVVVDLQKQLQAVEKQLKPISIKINVDSSSMDKATKSNNQITESSKKAQQQLSNYEKVLNQTITAYKKQSLSAEEYITKLNKATSMQAFKQLSDEKQIRVLNSLAQAEKDLSQIQSTRRKVENLQNQPSEDIKNHQKKLQMLQKEQQISQQKRSEYVEKYTPLGADRGITNASMERYNKYLQQQNELFKAGKISSEQYVSSIKIASAQTEKWGMVDNKVAAQILSNRKAIEAQAKRDKKDSDDKISALQKEANVSMKMIEIQKLKNQYEKITTSKAWNRSATSDQISQMENFNKTILDTGKNIRKLSDGDFKAFATSTRTSMSALNGQVQNLDRSSSHMGESIKEAFLKFPKM